MIISHRHKFIFISVPKVASASIEKALIPSLSSQDFATLSEKPIRDDPPLGLHAPLRAVMRYSADISKYFKFAFVRNPWERQVSLFSDLTQRVIDRYGTYNGATFKEWILSDTTLIRNALPLHVAIRFKKVPQHFWVCNGRQEVDFVGRFESLQQDFDHILKVIGLPSIQLPYENVTNHKHYLSYYDQKTIDIVRSWMFGDLLRWNYPTPIL